MMRGLLLTAITVAGCGITGTATAVPWSAADLREACADGDLYYIYGACAGYLTAVHDALPPGTVCLPDGTTIFGLEPAVDAIGGLEAIEGESGTDLALRALQLTFGCE